MAVALVGYDFTFYWAHRASHRINLLWAAHVVHHQSEDFNLSVGARVTLHSIFYFWFHLPLALVGVPPGLYLTAVAIHQLWQFTSHARILKNLGPIERILITPASHSVHHACNDEYLDKNFGGLFSVWDQIFGTFAAFDPKIEARYGTVRGMKSWNPVSAVFAPWFELLRLSVLSRSIAELRRVWLGTPDDLNARLAHEGARKPRHPVIQRGWNFYLLFQTIPPVLMTVVLMLDQPFFSREAQAAIWAFIAVTLGCLGCMLDGARWASAIEPARLLALSLLPASIAVVRFPSPRLSGLAMTAVAEARGRA